MTFPTAPFSSGEARSISDSRTPSLRRVSRGGLFELALTRERVRAPEYGVVGLNG